MATSKAKRRFWLMKSEPDVYSIDDLEREKRAEWDGVRNYQARNFMRDQMTKGDLVLFYHSNANPPGVAGIAKVAREAYPDPTQFDPASRYYDPKSSEEDPRWWLVDVQFVEKLPDVLSLHDLKADKKLAGMKVVQKGQRLSVQPVDEKHFRHVLAKAAAKTRV